MNQRRMKLRERFRRLTIWNKIGVCAAIAGIAAAVTAIPADVLSIANIGGATQPASVPEQLENVLDEAPGWKLAEPIRDVDLRGTGSTVRLLVLRPKRFGTGSDELRIYQIRSGKLTLAAAFHPLPLHENRAFAAGNPFQIRIVYVTDLDRNGSSEVVASLDELTSWPIPHPVIIGWDDEERRYRVLPLLAPTKVAGGARRVGGRHLPVTSDIAAPRLVRPPISPTRLDGHVRRMHARPAKVVDETTGEIFYAHSVDDFIVRSIGESFIGVIGGYYVAFGRGSEPPFIQIEKWLLFGNPFPREANHCPARPRPVVVRLLDRQGIRAELVRFWRRTLKGGWDC